VAPGGDDIVNIACCLVGGGFGDAGAGTSFAAPHVSGILALLLEADPTLDPDQLRDRIVADARKLPRGIVSAQGAGPAQLSVPRQPQPPNQAPVKRAVRRRRVPQAPPKKAAAPR
jgi:serine protease AprX